MESGLIIHLHLSRNPFINIFYTILKTDYPNEIVILSQVT